MRRIFASRGDGIGRPDLDALREADFDLSLTGFELGDLDALLAGEESTFEGNTSDFWLGQDLPLLARCDELHVICLPGWEASRGVQAEIALESGSQRHVSSPILSCHRELESSYCRLVV